MRDDYDRRYSFNTAIASIMELSNAVNKFDDQSAQGRAVCQEALETLILLLNPITPHICHALWQDLGHPETLLDDLPFPQVDPQAVERAQITLAVQINGKLRATLSVSPQASHDVIRAMACSQASVVKFLADKTIRKVIVVPGKIVNIVAA